MHEEKVVVHLSKSLYDLITARIKETTGEFTSVDDYIEVVLRTILTKDDGEESYSQEDKKLIKERLRRLGYL